MKLCEFEDKKVLVIFGGGMHPPLPHHMYMVNSLKKLFPNSDLFVASSDNTKERPFDFNEKKFLASQAGIPEKAFIQVSSPYNPREITSKYDPNNTILIFGISSKDGNRFGNGLKSDGSKGYFQPYKNLQSCEVMKHHAYFVIIPSISYSVLGQKISSASQIRDMYKRTKNKIALIKALYPNANNVALIKTIFDNVLMNINESLSMNAFEKEFPRVRMGDELNGLIIGNDVSNQDSIGAELYEYEILPGIRKVKMWEGGCKYYNIRDIRQVNNLIELIKTNKYIDPLIVVIDNEGPYILEGGHRFDALRKLGVEEFPAMVVIDTEEILLEDKKAQRTVPCVDCQNGFVQAKLSNGSAGSKICPTCKGFGKLFPLKHTLKALKVGYHPNDDKDRT